MQDGYTVAIQNLRGRFKSEGEFLLSSWVDLKDPKATNETTDAYDSIEWLVKNIPNNNGKVGMWGVSYDGLTTALTLLHPHTALKAISEQASPVDQWMNDDDHRYGALRESYNFEYDVLEQADKNKNTHFEFETYDTYQWYLDLGPVSNINDQYLHGSIPYWNSNVEHPDYDEFWKKEAWVRQLHSSSVPNLNVAGFWDQEDPWGPWQIFRHSLESDPAHTSLMVAGPWFHGQWQSPKGDYIGQVKFGGHETAREFRENLEAPFFRYYLHGKGEPPQWQATMFQSGSNQWRTYACGRRRKQSRRSSICMRMGRCRSRRLRQGNFSGKGDTASTCRIRRTRCLIARRFRRRIRERLANGKWRIRDLSITGQTCSVREPAARS
jgi:putative CocE/NonD family hydrolase